MDTRQLLASAALVGLAWAIWQRSQRDLAANPAKPAVAAPSGAAGPNRYAASTQRRESAGDPLAKNPRSSASGLYQFTRATWLRLGGQWGPDPRKPFGGLTPSPAEQRQKFDQLTADNAARLKGAGVKLTDGALYAAHFLGSTGAVKVLKAPDAAPLAAFVGSATLAANPHLRGWTVGQFRAWTERSA